MDYDSDDLATIRDWTDAVKAQGAAPSRVPSGANRGLLAARMNGPGTVYPNDPEGPAYVLAPPNVLAADARVSAQLADDQSGALLSFLAALGIAPGIAGNTTFMADLQRYALVAALGIGALVLLPYLLPARRR